MTKMPPFLISSAFNFKSNSFDFIRLILAILVVISHSESIGKLFHYSSLEMKDYNEYGTSIGTLAVYGFFVISGFLITRSFLNNRSIDNFCINRLKRIYPGFLVSLFFTSFLFIPLYYFIRNGFDFAKFYDLYRVQIAQYFVQNIFIEIRKPIIPSLIESFDINGPYWSLIHEVRAYFMVLILGALGILKRKIFVFGLAVIFNIIYIVNSLQISFKFGNNTQLFRDFLNTFVGDSHLFIIFTYFIFGMAFYLFLEKIIWNNWLYALSILGLILSWKLDFFPIIAPTYFTYFILYSSQILPFKNLAKKIGDLSYGIYIYSWPIQICLFYVGLNRITGNEKLDYLYFVVWSIVLSMFAGFLSWNLVEKRFLTNRKN